MSRTTLLPLLLHLLAPLAPAAGQTLLADLDTRVASFGIPVGAVPIELGQILLFAHADGRGVEPWAFDSATGLGRCIADLRPGPDSSDPTDWLVLGSLALFVARGDGVGFELWRTDGTPTGTSLVLDLMPGADSSGPAELTLFAGACYFTATDPSGGRELWRTDGTAAGTMQVVDLRAGADGSQPAKLTVFQNRLWFRADDGLTGSELWSTDGTAAGTTLLADLRPGVAGSSPSDLTADGSRLSFLARPASATELYVTDGTSAGLTSLSNLGGNRPPLTGGAPFRADGGTLFFTVQDYFGIGTEPWASDGTSAGTIPLGDLYPGRGDARIAEFFVEAGTAWFGADDGLDGLELWRSDGTTAGTQKLVSLEPGGTGSDPRGFARLPGTAPGFVFFAGSPGRRSLWFSDGTATGTVALPARSAFFANEPSPRPRAGGTLAFFGADPASGAPGVWETDGTAAGTRELWRVPIRTRSSYPVGFARNGGDVLFQATTEATGAELHGMSIASGTLRLLFELETGTGSGVRSALTGFGTDLLFHGGVASRDTSLFRSDGTPTGTVRLSPPSSRPSTLEVAVLDDGRAVFDHADPNGLEPWVTDGTPGGTLPLADLCAGSSDSRPAVFVSIGSLALFTAQPPGFRRELYATDGTPGNVTQISSSSGVSEVENLARFGGHAVFAGYVGTSGLEPCLSDGTVAGTRLIADLEPGSVSSQPRAFTASGDRCFFLATSTGLGEELWVTDGSALGTSLVRDLRPGPDDSGASDLTPLGNGRIAFVCDDGLHGDELWISDGTAAGTHLLVDLVPGPGFGVERGTLWRDRDRNRLFFAAVDGPHGLQPWTSDGTSAGTRPIGRIDAGFGPGIATVAQITRIDDLLMLSLDDGTHGAEAWSLDLGPLDLADASVYGTGCSAVDPTPTLDADGMPRLGNLGFGFYLRNGTPRAPVSVLFAAAPAAQPLDGCTVLLTPRLLVGAGTILGMDGTGAARLPIPNDPSLSGVTLFAQAVLLNPGGALFGDADLTNGVQIRLGQ